MFTESNIKSVEDYQLLTKSGRKIRKATKVVFKNNKEIKFIEKIGKKDAIKNALYQVNKDKSILE